MARRTPRFPTTWNFADLIDHLGHISPRRIRIYPTPGTATERDVIAIQDHENRSCELIEGVLVEKAMGYRESFLAGVILHWIAAFLDENDLGIVTPPDGVVRLGPGLVRAPDVAFVSWDQLPGHVVPELPIPDLAPDLAVEVLSRSNTKEEMDRKLKDYFFAGVRLVWLVNPNRRTVKV